MQQIEPRLPPGPLDPGDPHSLTVAHFLPDVLLNRERFHLLLQDFSIDRATFYGRYGCTQESFLDETEQFVAAQPDGSRDARASVLLLFGRSIEISSRYAGGGDEPSPVELDYLEQIVNGSHGIPDILHSMYDFQSISDGRNGLSDNAVEIDWSTLTLHRLGTTSLIFSVYTNGLDPRKLALKLNHVLFTTVGPIATATSSYFAEWRDVSRHCPYTPRVFASGTGWILEEFIEGPTLREFIRANVLSDDSLTLTLKVFPAILEALQSFHSANHGQGHGDLNPANIIVQSRSAAPPEISARDSRYEYVVYLIDMGRNLLASDTIGRVMSVDASFVAPEVRRLSPKDRVVDRSADFFSLGYLLAFCLGYDETDGFYYLDERLFRDQPMLARLACGLINNDARSRVRYVRTLAKKHIDHQDQELQILASYAVALMEMLKELTDQSLMKAHVGLHVLAQGLFGTWTAVGIAGRQLIRTWKRRQVLSLTEVLGSARIIASAFAYLFGAVTMIYVVLLEIHRDPLTLGGAFRLLGFQRSDHLFNYELLMVGGSFLVASFQYNVVVYGGISFWRTSANLLVRVLSEIWLWIVTVTVLGCVAAALFINPELWILVSAIGQTMAVINNILAMAARRKIAQALEQNTAALPWYKTSAIVRQARYDILSYWTPTYIAFTSFLYTLAILADLGLIHDFMVYAIAITVVNIFVLSYSQATRQGPILRGNLSQYALAGENLELSEGSEPGH